MRTSRPTTWSSLSSFEIFTHTFEMLEPSPLLLHGRDPADPFILCERSETFPELCESRSSHDDISHIIRKLVKKWRYWWSVLSHSIILSGFSLSSSPSLFHPQAYQGSEFIRLFLRHLARIHPESFPYVSIEILEISTIHESMVIGVDCLRTTCRDCLLEEAIDFGSWVELKSIQDLGRCMSIRDRLFPEEIRTKSMWEKHYGERIIVDHGRGIVIRKLCIFRESDRFIEGSCFWDVCDGEIDIEFCHRDFLKNSDKIISTYWGYMQQWRVRWGARYSILLLLCTSISSHHFPRWPSKSSSSVRMRAIS